MYSYRYPRPGVTTDCVIFGFDGTRMQVLLIERGNDPYKGCWALPGGFLNIDEPAEDGARRELQEETGLTVDLLHQFHTFSHPDRDPRGRTISIAYYGLIRLQPVCGGDDAARAQWFSMEQLPPLAFDHDEMLQRALMALRQQSLLQPVVRGVIDEPFAIDTLLTLYESILGTTLNSSAFCNAMTQRRLIAMTAEHDPDGHPLFRFGNGDSPLQLFFE
ncbi:MAG: NUDIX hydrolase [Bacteroidales bacterium]|nr:NUDIX hydrolase [Bacteroidales bacterium]